MTVNQLEAEVNEQLAEVRAMLRKKSRTWLILLGLAVVIIGWLLFTLFRRQPDSDTEGLKREIELLKRDNARIDTLIKYKDKEYQANRPKETKVKNRINEIPKNVDRMPARDIDSILSKYDY